MSKATKFRKIRDGMTAAIAALGATSLIAGFMVLGTAGAAQANGSAGQTQTSSNQVWVCKYTGGPNQGFTLRDANQPQRVGANSIQEGDSFADANPTIKIAEGDADPAPTVADCPQPPPLDVCDNLEGDQASVPDGYELVEGECVVPEPEPVDVCDNLEGVQASVPDGYELVEGECVVPEPEPVDVCDNLEGDQASVPDGYELVEGECVVPEPEPVDVCDNLEGVQASVPDGYELVDGDCVEKEIPPPPPVNPPVVEPPVVTPPTTDVCSNIPGKQGSVPLGYTAVDGVCTKDGVAGEGTEAPKPAQPAKSDKPKGQKPGAGEVLGEEAVPTAVAAGIGGPAGSIGSPSSLLGQGLVAGGLMMLLLAGSAQMGRRQRGAHEH